jgi:large subunit ribosomal protein L15
MPLYRRLAQRGFSNYPFRKEYRVVNLGDIAKKFEESETVDAVSLTKKGLVKGKGLIKILGDGEFSGKFSFTVDAVSASAREKIEKAGGRVRIAKKAIKTRGKAGKKAVAKAEQE